jgi:uncharacterized membrane protein
MIKMQLTKSQKGHARRTRVRSARRDLVSRQEPDNLVATMRYFEAYYAEQSEMLYPSCNNISRYGAVSWR